ncbi:MAG TPA: hypothetical protein VGO11_11360 [Chthoniobacteraceae bacterium]|jgi:hypothetical protein|nr:hypothetical protein [Chthoniobacteraceae bacterium]
MFRKHALNVIVGLPVVAAFWHFVVVPLYRLLHLGVRAHGSMAEDPDFYYSLIAVSLIRFGEALGITFCLLAIGCALGTPLGFGVPPEDRSRERIWCWYAPFFFFSLEIIGRFQVQRWYAEHGVMFPFTSFLRDFVPHLWWLLAAWLLTAPAILTGRGLYHFFSSAETSTPPQS